MDITSLRFLVFAVASIIIYYLLSEKLRIGFLAIVSCLFIASHSLLLLAYILLYAAVNFYLGYWIFNSKNKVLVFRIGVILSVSQIVLLKYGSFAIDPIFRLLGGDNFVSGLSTIILPIGISYFTLQGIGYLFNIKMGWEKPESNLLRFFLYIIFYPKFLSGPVERSNHFLPQIRSQNGFNEGRIIDALRLVLLGLFKKIAIANQLAPIIIQTYTDSGIANYSSLWIILLIQPLYLYFDFSGYTDIAIGLAKAYGIDLVPNFNKPFLAENVTTFWKRFHISLASWFNDYVFRQIGYKRRQWGQFATIYALLITWILFGIWHGAGWNFMLLGLVQAVAIIYEYFTRKWRVWFFSYMPSAIKVWIGRCLTYVFYAGSLIFFFSPNTEAALAFIKGLCCFVNPISINTLRGIPVLAIISILILLFNEIFSNDFTNYYSKFISWWYKVTTMRTLLRWTFYCIIIVILIVFGDEAQHFVYAQF